MCVCVWCVEVRSGDNDISGAMEGEDTYTQRETPKINFACVIFSPSNFSEKGNPFANEELSFSVQGISYYSVIVAYKSAHCKFAKYKAVLQGLFTVSGTKGGEIKYSKARSWGKQLTSFVLPC